MLRPFRTLVRAATCCPVVVHVPLQGCLYAEMVNTSLSGIDRLAILRWALDNSVCF